MAYHCGPKLSVDNVGTCGMGANTRLTLLADISRNYGLACWLKSHAIRSADVGCRSSLSADIVNRQSDD